jgi:hypothetical protein
MTDNINFKLVVPLIKSERTDGWYIKGVAAGVEPDKENDEFLPQTIQFLADQINGGGIPLRNHHKRDDIMEDMGVLVKADIDERHQLWVEARLDEDNPEAQYLWKKVNAGKQYGLSVRGQSLGYYYDVNKASNKRVRKHPMVLIEELSVTTRPVYTPSLGTVIQKAIDEASATVAAEGEMNETPEKNGGTSTTESSAPENDTSVELSPSDQLVKSLLSNAEFGALVSKAVSEAVKTQSTSDDSTEKPATPEPTSTVSAEQIVEIVKSTALVVGESVNERLQAILDRIPDKDDPAILVKAEEKTLAESLSELSAGDRLRVGLEALAASKAK